MKVLNKKGFGIIYAVIIILTIAMVSVSVLQDINRTSSVVTEEHIKTQMDLYSSSTIEYALLWLSQDQAFSNAPSKTLNITYPGNYKFKVIVTPLNIPGNVPESAGTVLLDITGEYTDNVHNIKTARRTIQKP